MAGASYIPATVVLVFALAAAVTDVWKFKVLNVVTLPLLASGFIYHGVAEGSSGLTASLLGSTFGFGALIAFYVTGGVGAGDVKLLAGVGAWLGMPSIFYVFITSALAAGVYALAVMVMYGRLAEHWNSLKLICYRFLPRGRHLRADDEMEAAAGMRDRSRVIPYAAMIAFGVLGTLIWTWKTGR